MTNNLLKVSLGNDNITVDSNTRSIAMREAKSTHTPGAPPGNQILVQHE